MAIQQLISYFNSYLALNSEEIEAVTKSATERKIKRKQYILQEGDVCKHYNFIVSGCFKMYSVDNSGKEHNIQLGLKTIGLPTLEACMHKNQVGCLLKP